MKYRVRIVKETGFITEDFHTRNGAMNWYLEKLKSDHSILEASVTSINKFDNYALNRLAEFNMPRREFSFKLFNDESDEYKIHKLKKELSKLEDN
jgi:hypothetical protein